MANSWFRMYSEFATDPKVQMLSEIDQRRFVMILCLRCNVTVTLHETLHDDEVAFQLRISLDDFQQTKRTLIARGLIDEGCNPCNWDKRQFVSDSSNNRVKRYRENMKRYSNVTCNAPVTAPDTDTDTDKKRNIKEKKSQNFKIEAREVLDWLNHRTGKKFRPSEVNLGLIVARLKGGVTADQCRAVIAVKCRQWLPDAKMAQYLRPATLFGREKFEQYLGELPTGGDENA